MLKRKRLRERGKLSLTKVFQKFISGDSVAVVRDLGQQSPGFPKRIQGRTGKVIGPRGTAYVVEIKDQNKVKQYIIKPVHLRKIKQIALEN